MARMSRTDSSSAWPVTWSITACSMCCDMGSRTRASSSTSPISIRPVDQALVLSVRANAPENARLTFDHVVSDRLRDMVDTNFKFYKRVTDDPQFAKFFLDWLFDRFRKNAE